MDGMSITATHTNNRRDAITRSALPPPAFLLPTLCKARKNSRKVFRALHNQVVGSCQGHTDGQTPQQASYPRHCPTRQAAPALATRGGGQERTLRTPTAARAAPSKLGALPRASISSTARDHQVPPAHHGRAPGARGRSGGRGENGDPPPAHGAPHHQRATGQEQLTTASPRALVLRRRCQSPPSPEHKSAPLLTHPSPPNGVQDGTTATRERTMTTPIINSVWGGMISEAPPPKHNYLISPPPNATLSHIPPKPLIFGAVRWRDEKKIANRLHQKYLL